MKQKLAVTFGIPVESWDHAAQPEGTAPTLGASLTESIAARLEAIDAAQGAAEELPDDEEALDALIAQLRRARGGDVAPALLVKIAAAETRAVEAREKLRSGTERAARDPEVRAYYGQFLEEVQAHPLAEIQLVRRFGAVTDADRERFDASYLAWRERHRELVEAAERASAALRRVLPPGARFDSIPATSAPIAA